MFCPGDTVVHNFTIPFAVNELAKVVVSYKQKDRIVKIIEVTSGFSQGSTNMEAVFSVTLSQQDTLLFDESYPYRAQLNVLTTTGTRCTSNEMPDKTGPQQYKRVIADG